MLVTKKRFLFQRLLGRSRPLAADEVPLPRIRVTDFSQKLWLWRVGLLALLVGNGIVPTTSLAATIQGVVFKDLNGDGQREVDEPPIAGQGIGLQNLYAPDWQPNPADSLNPSDADGNYAYQNLPESTFRLFLSQPTAIPFGWKLTTLTSTLLSVGENDTREVDLGFAPRNLPPVIGTTPDITAEKSKSPVFLQVEFIDYDVSDTHQCEWQFGDNQSGSSDANENPTEPSQNTCEIEHSYDVPGTYSVELVIIDSSSEQASTTFTVNVPNTLPTVAAGDDVSVNKATPVPFTGTVQDHDGDEITTTWNFGDDTPAVSNTLTPTHTYDNPGVYEVTLTATDSRGGTSSDQLIVTVETVAVFPMGDNGNPVESGDSVSIGLTGLPTAQKFTVHLDDDLGQQWSFAELSSDQVGDLDTGVLLFQMGVKDTHFDFTQGVGFKTFAEADAFFAAGHYFILTVKDQNGEIVSQRTLTFPPRTSPMIYSSTANGELVNALDLNDASSEAYMTGLHFPAGAQVKLFLVQNQRVWQEGDRLIDISGVNRAAEIETVTVDANGSFTAKIWSNANLALGSYDLVARIGTDTTPELLPSDIVAYGDDTALVVQHTSEDHILADVSVPGNLYCGGHQFNPEACEPGQKLTGGAFNAHQRRVGNSFEKGQDVGAAIDPLDRPKGVWDGDDLYGRYYVVEHQPFNQWTEGTPLIDVSGGYETFPLKTYCINGTWRKVWNDATQSERIKGYDLIIDVNNDGKYSPGVDILDQQDNQGNGAGFWVVEDPATAGDFAIGEAELVQDITDLTYPVLKDPMVMEWMTLNYEAQAIIKYPADETGTEQPVSNQSAPYPVVVFLHGEHFDCHLAANLNDYSWFLPEGKCTGTPIPNHAGYNYLLERLASQGFIALAINTHGIQGPQVPWQYELRGQIVLNLLDKLSAWNNGTIEPGHPNQTTLANLFAGKLDLTRIGLVGQGRGAEGVLAAEAYNNLRAANNRHNIKAIAALAPSDNYRLDQNVGSFVPQTSAYLLLTGGLDDVTGFSGYRIYERAYKDESRARQEKMEVDIYGANRNYFNSVWADISGDDADDVETTETRLTEEQQQSITQRLLSAFFRFQLQETRAYKDLFAGDLKLSALSQIRYFPSYQGKDRMTVDDFEQGTLDDGVNTLGGTITTQSLGTVAEKLLANNPNGCGYPDPSTLSNDTHFRGCTKGVILTGNGGLYETTLPAGKRDVSDFRFLSFKVAKVVDDDPPLNSVGQDIYLRVYLVDGNGNTGVSEARTYYYDVIPHPQQRWGKYASHRTNEAILTGVDIPLGMFSHIHADSWEKVQQAAGGVNLKDVHKVVIQLRTSATIGIDEIEFTH